MESRPLINRVAQSKLKVINLEDYYPQNEFMELDIKEFLFHGLIVKEQEFRQKLKEVDWTIYQDNVLCIYCSTDAILPSWAKLLITSYATPYATLVYNGTKETAQQMHWLQIVDELDLSPFQDQIVVVKGCSDKKVPDDAYIRLVNRLQPIVKKLLFGEPCSTVPIYKRQ